MEISINKNVILVVFFFTFIGLQLISLVFVWSHYDLIYYTFSISTLNLFFTSFILLKFMDKEKETIVLDNGILKDMVKTKKETKTKDKNKGVAS